MDLMKLVNNRRLVVYGTGKRAGEFCEKYADELGIKVCTCSDDEFIPINGMTAVNHVDVSKENDYVIVCTDKYYTEIARQLRLSGYMSIIDFMRFDYFEKLYESTVHGKRIVIGVGRCLIHSICDAMYYIKDISDNFSIIWFDEATCMGYAERFSLEDAEDCIRLVEAADVFIQPTVYFPSHLIEFNRLIDRLRKDTILISIPIFDFDSYWPQDIDKLRTASKYYFILDGRKIDAYSARDRELEKLVDEGLTDEEIISRVKREDYFKKEVVLNNHKKTLDRIRLIEHRSSFEISGFVENSFSSVKLYCDRGHFNQNMLHEYIICVAKFLGFSNNVKSDLCIDLLEEMYGGVNEFPIYPSAAYYLNLSFIDNNTKYRMVLYDGIKSVHFDEYIFNILRYYRCGRELLDLCNKGQNDIGGTSIE